MRAVVQRVKSASVEVDGCIIGEIEEGILVYLGIGKNDNIEDARYVCQKLIGLRIFNDTFGKMNMSLQDINQSALIVSQFTLYGDCRKGKRPSYDAAMRPIEAKELYQKFLEIFQETGLNYATGEFQAHMTIKAINDGPVTVLIDSKRDF